MSEQGGKVGVALWPSSGGGQRGGKVVARYLHVSREGWGRLRRISGKGQGVQRQGVIMEDMSCDVDANAEWAKHLRTHELHDVDPAFANALFILV